MLNKRGIHLYAVVTIRVPEKLLQTRTLQELFDQHLPRAVLCKTDTFLDNVRAELLDGQGADISGELANDSVTETIVVQIENVLNDLMATSVTVS